MVFNQLYWVIKISRVILIMRDSNIATMFCNEFINSSGNCVTY